MESEEYVRAPKVIFVDTGEERDQRISRVCAQGRETLAARKFGVAERVFRGCGEDSIHTCKEMVEWEQRNLWPDWFGLTSPGESSNAGKGSNEYPAGCIL